MAREELKWQNIDADDACAASFARWGKPANLAGAPARKSCLQTNDSRPRGTAGALLR